MTTNQQKNKGDGRSQADSKQTSYRRRRGRRGRRLLLRQRRTRRTIKTKKTVTPTPTKATGGTLTVKIAGGDASQVTLSKCGKRQRAKVSGNRVSFSNVPVDTCSLKFSPSGVFTTVKGGAKTVSCHQGELCNL